MEPRIDERPTIEIGEHAEPRRVSADDGESDGQAASTYRERILTRSIGVRFCRHRRRALLGTPPPSARCLCGLFHRINRSVDDPNNITVVAGFPSRDAAKAFATNADLKEAMGRAGVAGAPRVEIFE